MTAKESHITGWLLATGHLFLTNKALESATRDDLFCVLTFLTGWLPSDKKVANFD